jgi:hypothetical protein
LFFLFKAWIDAISGVRKVKRESSVYFDNSNSEMNSVKRKRMSRVLEVKQEYPNKQVSAD